jgi:uncharacterized membrane protein YkvA (DUF1232 family)
MRANLAGTFSQPRRGSVAAMALVRFVPDCLVLFRRLAADRRIRRRHRVLLALAVVYLASPIDLVPDFIPVIGLLDDALLVAILMRTLLRAAGRDVLAELWPGPERSLELLLRAVAPRSALA